MLFWINLEFWVESKSFDISTIMYIFCDAKAGMEFGTLYKTATSVLFMPQFGKDVKDAAAPSRPE